MDREDSDDKMSSEERLGPLFLGCHYNHNLHIHTPIKQLIFITLVRTHSLGMTVHALMAHQENHKNTSAFLVLLAAFPLANKSQQVC
jgi:hypothetical protein